MPSSPRVLLLSCLFLSNGTCVVCMPTERSSVTMNSNVSDLVSITQLAGNDAYPASGEPALWAGISQVLAYDQYVLW